MTEAAPIRRTAEPEVDELITGAFIAVDGDTEFEDGWVAISDGRIRAVGARSDPWPAAALRTDAGGRLVTPGLINAHHHMTQNLTRAYRPAVNGTLFEWLTTLYPLWATLDEEDVYLATYVAAAELLLGGCTTSSDHMYIHPRAHLIDAQVAATTEIGFRFMANRGSMTRSVDDGGLPPREVVQDEQAILADSQRVIETFHDPAPGALTRVALAPCALFAVSEPIMRATADLAEHYDVRLHTHLAEDTDEDDYAIEVYGCRPVEYFERVGWASPRTWVAHYVYGSDEENRRLAAAGVSVTQCPSSNMILAGGSADTVRLRSLGMAVGIGCDGSASADSADLWQETRNAMLLGKYRHGPAAMTARDALDMATRGSAHALGWADELGHLRPGACADLVIWDSSPVAQAGALTDPVEAWLRSGPSRAWRTYVAGRALVADGELQLPDLEDVLHRHRAAAARIQGV